MSDDDDLHLLNCQIQAELNHEIRHALQRHRLEAERARLLLLRLAARSTASAEPIAVGVVAAPVAARQKVKPAGIPSVAEMIKTVLQEAGKGLRPTEITAVVRRQWWPEIPAHYVPALAARMVRQGRLTKKGGRYMMLNGHTNGAAQ